MNLVTLSEPAGDPDFIAPIARKSLAFVLAGGRGTRLGPLTAWRAKPAVPFGGKFRILDFTLSNCVNSGLRRIGVCTQYRAQSLIRHLQRGWSFLDGRFGDFIEVLPAQQAQDNEWYRGTADAVYQNLDLVRHVAPDHVVILAGDHIYKMDYSRMLRQHAQSGAKATVACTEVSVEEASAFGVVRAAPDGRVHEFQEKPARPAALPGRPGRALASMGIYVFETRFLEHVLRRDASDPLSGRDFGRDILPRLVREGEPVFVHDFARSCVNMAGERPYWRDVGTVDAFWEANLDLTRVVPDLNLYDRDWPIWTHQEQLPPAKFVFDEALRRGEALDSLISGGCIVSGSAVRRSLLFSQVHVHSYGEIQDAVILPNVDVGRNAVIRRAVIDEGCRLPDGFTVGVDPDDDRRRYHVTEGGVALVVPEMIGQQGDERRAAA